MHLLLQIAPQVPADATIPYAIAYGIGAVLVAAIGVLFWQLRASEQRCAGELKAEHDARIADAKAFTALAIDLQRQGNVVVASNDAQTAAIRELLTQLRGRR